jgi:hypothetical protein
MYLGRAEYSTVPFYSSLMSGFVVLLCLINFDIKSAKRCTIFIGHLILFCYFHFIFLWVLGMQVSDCIWLDNAGSMQVSVLYVTPALLYIYKYDSRYWIKRLKCN